MSSHVVSPGPERSSFEQTLEALVGLCASMQPGDRIPTHTELMRRFGASERTVLRALDELQRAGAIVRRKGAGTFVAQSGGVRGPGSPIASAGAADRRTIVAITQPDNSFFDRCISQLYRCVEPEELELVCRIVSPSTFPSLAPPPASDESQSFVFFRYDLAPLAKRLQDAGCRVVVVGAPPAGELPEVPCVYGDHEHGGYLATNHLLDLGHRRIGFAGSYNPKRTLRWRGHQRALLEGRRAGREIQDLVISPEEIDAWCGDPALAYSFFRQPEAPTGLVVWNDHEAVKVLSLLTHVGLRVPDDVSLVGYDALPEGKLVFPQLTTVDQGIGRQLHAALSVLTSKLRPASSSTVVVLPALVSRQSTAAPTSSEI